MFGLGPTELIIIFLIVLLIFGGKKIPEIARGLGKGIREFKKAKDGIEDSLKEAMKEEEVKKAEAEKEKKEGEKDKEKKA